MMTTSVPSSSSPSFYLSPEHWSPRYDVSFFTVKVSSRERLSLQEAKECMSNVQDSSALVEISERRFHPACYYRVEVLFGKVKRAFWRRFAHFQWLFDQVSIFPVHHGDGYCYQSDVPEFPRKTWIWEWPHSHEFEQERQDGLEAFLKALLSRPGYATHFAVVAFLEFQSKPSFDASGSTTNDVKPIIGTPKIGPSPMKQSISTLGRNNEPMYISGRLSSPLPQKDISSIQIRTRLSNDENKVLERGNQSSLPDLEVYENDPDFSGHRTAYERTEITMSKSDHHTNYVSSSSIEKFT